MMRIDQSNKAMLFWGWCGFWTLFAGAVEYFSEFVAMSHQKRPLPLNPDTYAFLAGLFGLVVGAAFGIVSGLLILLIYWLKTRPRKHEPISRYSPAAPKRKFPFTSRRLHGDKGA